MPTENRHIESIANTRANLQTNLDNMQFAIETDGTESAVYKDDDGTYHIIANQAEAATFTTIGATGTVSVAQYIDHTGDTDTLIEFTTNRIDRVAGGVTFDVIQETTQDIYAINPNNVDIDFSVGATGGVALSVNGADRGVTVATNLVVGASIYTSDDGTGTLRIGRYSAGVTSAIIEAGDADRNYAVNLLLRARDNAGVSQNMINIDAQNKNITMDSGLHVGNIAGTPGDNNLIVDGTATIGGDTCLTGSVLYLGATTTTANKWRIYDDGTNLLFQRYESSAWVTKTTIVA